MPVKTTHKKAAASLPAGLKASTRKVSPALRKMISQDRAIASGGRNIVQRQRAH
jgi:hypothetical protein